MSGLEGKGGWEGWVRGGKALLAKEEAEEESLGRFCDSASSEKRRGDGFGWDGLGSKDELLERGV